MPALPGQSLFGVRRRSQARACSLYNQKASKAVARPHLRGAIAQLGERIVRNDEVVGSIPTSSTIFWLNVFNSFNRAAFVLYKF